jgi:hypothetical protein
LPRSRSSRTCFEQGAYIASPETGKGFHAALLPQENLCRDVSPEDHTNLELNFLHYTMLMAGQGIDASLADGSYLHSSAVFSIYNTNAKYLSKYITSTSLPLISSPPLLRRQDADCSNSIVAAVESATVVVSRSFQQSLATASQALEQASIAASNAIQQASVASASAASSVAGASAKIASLSSSASVAVANASLSLVAVTESASSVEVSDSCEKGGAMCRGLY